MVTRPAALTALLALLALVGCGDAPEGHTSVDSSSSAETATCRRVDAPQPKPDGGQTEPTEKLNPKRVYDLVFETSCGNFRVRIAPEQAPNTAASVVSLVRKGFYDHTTFHRVVPGFVVQGGDPTGTGTGGPGYSTVDRPGPRTQYTPGIVAMAKTGTEPAGTSGSQFYVVSGPQAAELPKVYAVIGSVIDGMGTIARIDALGNASDPTGTPRRPIVIEKVSLQG
jgi:cyclophilin family peptidyl-prolyl cis-trans isomerase